MAVDLSLSFVFASTWIGWSQVTWSCTLPSQARNVHHDKSHVDAKQCQPYVNYIIHCGWYMKKRFT